MGSAATSPASVPVVPGLTGVNGLERPIRNAERPTTETWTYTVTGTAATGQYANVATVNANAAIGTDPSDTDPSHYFGVGPKIEVEKSTNGQDADTAPGPYVAVGDPITWVYVVTNTGILQRAIRNLPRRGRFRR